MIVTLTSALSGSVYAAPITSNTLINTYTYDFSQGPSYYGKGPVTRAIGPVSMTWTASPGSVFDYTASFYLGGNGLWGSGRGGYAGVNNFDTMSFLFDKGISGVGGLVNYGIPSSSSSPNLPILNIYGVGGALLETLNLVSSAPVSTPGQADRGAFRGFQRTTADIFRLEVVNGLVIDDLVISYQSNMAAVPLPAGLPLFACGICLLGLLGWRNRRASGLQLASEINVRPT